MKGPLIRKGQFPGRPRQPVDVTMSRAAEPPTPDQALWVVIRNSAEALSFENYATFIEPIMCGTKSVPDNPLPFPDAEPYRLLKTATEVFMMAHCGVAIEPEETLLGETTLESAISSTL